MQTSLKSRLSIFLQYLGVGQAKFAQEVGLSKGFANNIGDNIRSKTLNKITQKYPNLNTVWLLTGEGEMLKTDTSTRPESQPKQLEFDFNRWMENEEKKTAYLQKLITTNSQLSSTNSELVEMLKEAMSKSGKGEFQNQIDELSRRIDRFLESWSQKRAEDAI